MSWLGLNFNGSGRRAGDVFGVGTAMWVGVDLGLGSSLFDSGFLDFPWDARFDPL